MFKIISSFRRYHSVRFKLSLGLDLRGGSYIIDHGPEATQYLKAFLGEHYIYSDKPVLKALWENYNDCQFVDNKG